MAGWKYSIDPDRLCFPGTGRASLAVERSVFAKKLADQGLKLAAGDGADHPRCHPVVPIQDQGARDRLLGQEWELAEEGSVGVDQLRIPHT